MILLLVHIDEKMLEDLGELWSEKRRLAMLK